jgi:hypothetical protein
VPNRTFNSKVDKRPDIEDNLPWKSPRTMFPQDDPLVIEDNMK